MPRFHWKIPSPGAVIWALCTVLLFGVCFTASSQSTDQAYPTAITENQISGRINARDLGDPRLTTYFYVFNGRQGDLFVNVVTRNLSGSIDIFSMDGLRPLTKILVYADLAQSETGRVLYLRQPQKLMLRVEGRTPNDDPAEFQLKFAGSFEAAIPSGDEPPVPKVSDAAVATDSGVRVNSVGTIVEVIPRTKPTPKAEKVIAESRPDKTEPKPEEARPETAEAKPEKAAEISGKPAETEKPVEVSEPKTEEPAKTATKATSTPRPARTRRRNAPPVKPVQSEAEAAKEPPVAEPEPEPTPTRRPPKVVVTDNVPKAEPSPLANVHLVIVFKDGRRVERPMTEVIRFTADQTTLTVVSKNGRVVKFPILDVASVTIQ